MDTDVTQLINDQIKKLPPIVQHAIASTDLRQNIRTIGEKNKLHIDQMGLLEDETLFVMLGFENPDSFIDNLVKNAHMSPDVASKVADDVAVQVFMPIRDAMKEFMTPPAEQKSVIMPSMAAVVATRPTPTVLVPPKVPVVPDTTISPVPPVMPTPPTTLVPQAPKPPAPPPQKPEMHSAEMMLREKTVSVPVPAIPPPPFVTKPPVPLAPPVAPTKPVPPKPTNYKADPYREPIEP